MPVAAGAEVGLADGRQNGDDGEAPAHAETLGERPARELHRPFRTQGRRPQELTGLVVDPSGQADHRMRHPVAPELGRGGADELDERRRCLGMPGCGLGTPVQDGAVGVHQRRSHLGPADVGGQNAPSCDVARAHGVSLARPKCADHLGRG